jgi:hypothetical protein
VPFVPTVIALLLVGVLVLVFVAVRLAGALRRFGMVRRWLDDYLSDRTGMLRARSAALGVAVAELRADPLRRGLVVDAPDDSMAGSRAAGPRTIETSTEGEYRRA